MERIPYFADPRSFVERGVHVPEQGANATTVRTRTNGRATKGFAVATKDHAVHYADHDVRVRIVLFGGVYVVHGGQYVVHDDHQFDVQSDYKENRRERERSRAFNDL